MNYAVLLALLLFPSLAYADADLPATRAKAEAGEAAAEYQIGLKYYQGSSVGQNYAEAAKWFRKSAQQGFAMAQFDLGVMYSSGKGVTQDDQQAYVWLSLAAQQEKSAGASKALDLAAKRLSTEALAKAQKQAAKRFEEIKRKQK